MNIYEELWYETEGGNIKNLKLKYSLKFYRYSLIHYGMKITKKFYTKMKFNVPYIILGDYSLFSQKLKKWIKNNILNELNKEKIINLCIHSINNCITEKNDKCRDLYIKSFKELGVIKDIEIDNEVLKITLINNKEYKLLRLLKNKDEISCFERNCHDICYKYFKKNNSDITSNVVTVFERDLFNRKQYHSFILKDNIVYDYSRNIATSFETYKTLFKPEILINDLGMNILEEIEELERFDNDFIEVKNWCPILKYTLHTICNKK